MPLLLAALIAIAVQSATAQTPLFQESRDHPAIGYSFYPPTDPIAALNAKLRNGSVRFDSDPYSGYLRSVLRALGIPVESQMAVFSKTSLQAPIIGPHNARSIFFNDSTVIAWVPGEHQVEAASQDPRQGVIFYALNQFPDGTPQFVRSDDCLSCHETHSSLGIPGMIVRSLFPAPTGLPERTLGEYDTDHRSPLAERWGGWYVTGKTGALQHMGNAVYTDRNHPETRTQIQPEFRPQYHLAQYSDVAALMVFEHQMHLMNLLTGFGWEIRIANYEKRSVELAPSAKEIVNYMLFTGEATLPNPVQSTSGFTEAFAAVGIKDSKGRSLKDLDLTRRLMRYPCSYMIYSAAFDALPDVGRDAVYRLLWQVLNGEKKGPEFAHLSATDRAAILEILRDTKQGLPDYFRAQR